MGRSCEMRALIFDIDDTLYDLADPFVRTFEYYYGGMYEIDVIELFKYVRIYSDEVFEASESGEISMDDMYAYRLQKAFAKFHLTLSREDALKFQHTYEAYQKEISMSDAMKRCLDELGKTSVFSGLISNGKYEHQMDKVKILGLTKWFPKEHIIISGGCGYSKPDVQIFKYAEKTWNLDPETTWYIGDTFQNDIEGPNKAGWHTVWYNHRKNKAPENAPKPDKIVTTEAELINLIMRLSGNENRR